MNVYANIKLDRAQQEAVDTEGNLVVAAIPGSGKTAVLTHRVKRLIDEGADPSRILAVTFLKKAQESLVARLKEVVGVRASLVQVRTFHSVGSKILRAHGDYVAPGFSRASLLEWNELKKVYRENLRQVAKNRNLEHLIYASGSRAYPAVSPFKLARYCSCVYDLMLEIEGNEHGDVHVSAMEGAGFEYVEAEFRLMAECLRLIDASKLRDGWMTFDDLLHKAVLLLAEDRGARDDACADCEHVLVDEYQDTSPSQQTFIDILSSRGSLMIVGDDDQAVFGWRRADPKLLIEATMSPRFNVVKLETNYRSGSEILKHAQRLIEHNKDRIPKKLKATREGGEVYGMILDDKAHEASWVVEKLEELVRSGQPLHEVMVLFRTNAQLGDLAEQLVEAKIPHQMPPKASGFADLAEVLDMEAYLQVAIGNIGDGAERIFNRPWRGLPPQWGDALDRFIAKAGPDAQTSVDALQQMPFIGSYRSTEEKGRAKLFEALRSVQAAGQSGDSTFGILTTAITATGYREWLATDEDDEDNYRGETVDKVLELAARKKNPAEFLSMLRAMRHATKKGKTAKNAVMLSTIHRAKGLEADVVFLLGCKPGSLPHSRAGASIEEERRLCYVACTRARHVLYVSSDAKPQNLKDPIVAATDFLTELNIPCQRLSEFDPEPTAA